MLAHRATSSYPISIGTSIALESLQMGPNKPYDETRKVPNKIDLNEFTSVYCNTRTLLRNIIASTDIRIDRIDPKDLYLTLEEEVESIWEIVSEINTGISVNFYAFSVRDIFRRMPTDLVSVRNPTTDKQKLEYGLVEGILSRLATSSVPVLKSRVELKPTRVREDALILTHVPYDLLSSRNFKSMKLLESHTGVLKPRTMWNTKYYKVPKETMVTLPFVEKLLYILGDNVLFKPANIKIRKTILGIAKERVWTPRTSRAVVDSDLKRFGGNEIKQLIQRLPRYF